ncbi:stage II sporulation protein M [Paenibacillus albicereus]|uniref:Stage II sporulation protein M n=1 Tax=Paenibacillus albicereus TaxID=2726185 RepID=A0A6H2GWM8_9BACL|nr:stage II sporulation protein M [Paenibacillus albicereus]QJC51805.1 stage II sporulation protein M [Paenibacillus albicereus]
MRAWVRGRSKEERLLFAIAASLCAAGIVCGALLAGGLGEEQRSLLAADMSRFLQRLVSEGAPPDASSFWVVCWLHGRWLLLIVLLGVSVIGLPLLAALDFFKGVLIGFAVATLAVQHGGRGVAFSFVAVAPSNLLALPAYLAASAAAASFALHLVRFRLMRRQGPLLPAAAALAVTAAASTLLLAAASAAEAWLSPPLMAWAAQWLVPG